jgi:cell division protein FtsW
MKDKKPLDFWLLITVLVLLSLGLIMVFSASAPTAQKDYNDIYFIIKSQLAYAVLGLIAMAVVTNINYRVYGKFTPILMAFSIITLILVLVPGVGKEANGAWRWIFIGPINFQPSEITKLAVIMFVSWKLSRRSKPMDSFIKDFLPYMVLLGVIALLLLKEPHLSATVIIGAIFCVVLFAGGAKIRHFFIVGLPAVAGLFALMIFTDYMKKRLDSFIDPWSDLLGSGWQTVQSLYAIGSGGIFGRGIGQSMQKFLYIPEPHNDYIFAILAEELGFIGVFAVLLLFLIFIWRGIKIAMNAPDVFGSLLAVGITSLIGIQALFNIAVVSKAVPPTGVSLPFFSSGGTSLILFLVEVGILLNISRYSKYDRI